MHDTFSFISEILAETQVPNPSVLDQRFEDLITPFHDFVDED